MGRARPRPTWAHGWAQTFVSHSQAGQGCVELEPGPVGALLGLELTATGLR